MFDQNQLPPPPAFPCPTCGIDCYSKKVLKWHLAKTTCSGVTDTTLAPVEVPPPALLDWEVNPGPVLYFGTLIDRLADRYHQLTETLGSKVSIKKLCSISGIKQEVLRSILVSRTAEAVDCLDADRIMRALELDINNLMTHSDNVPIPHAWADRRERIRAILSDTEVEAAVALEAVRSSSLDAYRRDTLEARLGGIINRLDAIRLILRNPNAVVELGPKSKADYKREILAEYNADRPRGMKKKLL